MFFTLCHSFIVYIHSASAIYFCFCLFSYFVKTLMFNPNLNGWTSTYVSHSPYKYYKKFLQFSFFLRLLNVFYYCCYLKFFFIIFGLLELISTSCCEVLYMVLTVFCFYTKKTSIRK